MQLVDRDVTDLAGLSSTGDPAFLAEAKKMDTAIDPVSALSEESLGVRIVLVAVALLCFGVGSAFYIAASLGAGPRDSLMLVIARRTPLRIGAEWRFDNKATHFQNGTALATTGQSKVVDKESVTTSAGLPPCRHRAFRSSSTP